MNTRILIGLLLLAYSPLSSQTTLELHPTADCVVGFHDGENSANENAGNASHFSSFWQPAWTGVGENGGYGLIKFDLTSIPEGSIITAANLELHAFGDDFSPYLSDGHEGANACWLQRITEDWEEYAATWNTKPSMTSDGQISVPASTDPYEDYNLDISTFVQDMVDDPAANFGFALKLQNESPTRGLMFHSSDATDEGTWPKLTVTYTEPVPIFDQTITNTLLSMFPNPTTDNIQINIPIEGANCIIKIYDLNGNNVLSLETMSTEVDAHVAHLSNGIYSVLVTPIGSIYQYSGTFCKI